MEPKRVIVFNDNRDEEKAWACRTESEANNMIAWLKDNGVTNVKLVGLSFFNQVPFLD